MALEGENAEVFMRVACLSLVCLLGSLACTSVKSRIVPDQVEQHKKIQEEADGCFKKGDHASLERAAELYSALSEVPDFQEKCREKLLKTYMLLGLRTKELGILENAYLRKARDLFNANPELASFKEYLNLIHIVGVNISGILGEGPDNEDLPPEKYFDWARKNAGEISVGLKQSALSDDFFAYLYLALYKDFAYWTKEKIDFTVLAGAHSCSPLVQYKLSLVPQIEPDKLENLLLIAPEFTEARLFLGMARLAQGKMVPAEEHFSQAHRSYPQSLSCLMGLARACFYFEEFSKCLDYYDEMLQRAPYYREALLGRVVCLSYLGRHEDALETCRKIRELGKYYVGESHFWSAHSLYDMGHLESALQSIEDAEKYIFGSYEVLLLKGKIHFALNHLDEAEKSFRDVLKISSADSEAAFHLGKISAEKILWLDSGNFFALAAEGSRMIESSLEDKIKEINASGLSEERRARMLLKKEWEIKREQLKTATSFYNAAAGYFNAGLKDKALDCATQALEHPSFKDLAEALIVRIRGHNTYSPKFE